MKATFEIIYPPPSYIKVVLPFMVGTYDKSSKQSYSIQKTIIVKSRLQSGPKKLVIGLFKNSKMLEFGMYENEIRSFMILYKKVVKD